MNLIKSRMRTTTVTYNIITMVPNKFTDNGWCGYCKHSHWWISNLLGPNNDILHCGQCECLQWKPKDNLKYLEWKYEQQSYL